MKFVDSLRRLLFLFLPVEELLFLHRGQGLDLLWRDSLQCPTEEEYIHMVRDSKLFQHHGSSLISQKLLACFALPSS
jgi:hypothetical protein